MSEDFIFALATLVAGLAIFGVGAYLLFHQKLYYNADDKSVVTELDVPLLGKVKTNLPAIVLCFIGLVPILLAYNEMKGRNPTLVQFSGEVTIDPTSIGGINAGTPRSQGDTCA